MYIALNLEISVKSANLCTRIHTMCICTTICDMDSLSSQSLPGACVYYAWEEGPSSDYSWNAIKLKHRNGERDEQQNHNNGSSLLDTYSVNEC